MFKHIYQQKHYMLNIQNKSIIFFFYSIKLLTVSIFVFKKSTHVRGEVSEGVAVFTITDLSLFALWHGTFCLEVDQKPWNIILRKERLSLIMTVSNYIKNNK